MTRSSADSDSGLPRRGSLRTHQRIIIAHHLVLHGYGHWLPNDPLGEAFAEVIQRERYTVRACAVLSNHAHLCIRRHRDDGRTMWKKLAAESQRRLRLFADVPENHPVWSDRPYVVFLYVPDEVHGRVRYIEGNPAKESLSPQRLPFVASYDGWPRPKAITR